MRTTVLNWIPHSLSMCRSLVDSDFLYWAFKTRMNARWNSFFALHPVSSLHKMVVPNPVRVYSCRNERWSQKSVLSNFIRLILGPNPSCRWPLFQNQISKKFVISWIDSIKCNQWSHSDSINSEEHLFGVINPKSGTECKCSK